MKWRFQTRADRVDSMKKAILLAASSDRHCNARDSSGAGTFQSDIEYQGRNDQLTKYYLSFEDYKDDPDNIDPSRIKRVERLVMQAPIGHHFGRPERIG